MRLASTKTRRYEKWRNGIRHPKGIFANGFDVAALVLLLPWLIASLYFLKSVTPIVVSTGGRISPESSTVNSYLTQRVEPIKLSNFGGSHDRTAPHYAEFIQRFKLNSPPPNVLNPSLCLHMMQVLGPDAAVFVSDSKATDKVLLPDILLCDDLSIRYLGEAAVIRTPYGLRFPTYGDTLKSGRADESHRDHSLASLALLGFPLSQPIFVNTREHTLREVLRDSLANFHLSQRDLEWTALAYSLYLPPTRIWTNRYGETFDFDQLVQELLRRPLLASSCGGTHVLMSLTAIVRVDERYGVLSSASHDAIHRRLQGTLDIVVKRQDPRGFWSPISMFDLPMSRTKTTRIAASDFEDSFANRQIITSHIALWLNSLDGVLLPPAEVVDRATSWLAETLIRSNEEEFWTRYCPLTHALCAIRSSTN